jgi:hypothetical protein
MTRSGSLPSVNTKAHWLNLPLVRWLLSPGGRLKAEENDFRPRSRRFPV